MVRNSERGAVTVIVAIMMILIFVCVALVVDIGHIHNSKIELQRAVDAAALAAAQELPAGSIVATAEAFLLANQIDKNDAHNTISVTPGSWNETIIPGQTAANRFTPGAPPLDAVMVAVSRTVEHYFFFFTPGTTVTADAIAVAKPINPVVPLALISCIPTAQSTQNPGSLPGMTICDIRTYNFKNDQDDTSAWTSLTFNANANEVGEFMLTDTGRDRFNSVIFGRGLPNDGIENTSVDVNASTYSSSYSGCNPDGLTINCGLGGIAGKELASRADFPVPAALPNLSRDTISGIYSPTTFDPVTGYAQNGALPRWYNMDESPGLQREDHFARVWSQDGILLRGVDGSGNFIESFTTYQDRLQTYFAGTVRPYNDDRFADSGGKMITQYTGGMKNTILQSLGIPTGSYSSIYYPDYSKVVKSAGYPKVYVFNGVAGSILSEFLNNPQVSDGTNLRCRDDPALPEGQYALVLKTPVIFAGSCETWKGLSQSNAQHTLSYVGLAKLLVTRLWKNPNRYDCGGNFVNVGGCGNIGAFDPPPGAGGDLSAVPFSSPGAMEGVNLVPVSDNFQEQASLLKIVLVE